MSDCSCSLFCVVCVDSAESAPQACRKDNKTDCNSKPVGRNLMREIIVASSLIVPHKKRKTGRDNRFPQSCSVPKSTKQPLLVILVMPLYSGRCCST